MEGWDDISDGVDDIGGGNVGGDTLIGVEVYKWHD
jgi:hypothetical protein